MIFQKQVTLPSSPPTRSRISLGFRVQPALTVIRKIRQPLKTIRTLKSTITPSTMFTSAVYLILLAVIGLSHGYTYSPHSHESYRAPQTQSHYYQSRALQNYPQNDINRPVIYPQLGMSPEYHNLVYKYITGFAGNEEPPHVKVDDFDHDHAAEPEEDELSHEPDKENEETGQSGSATEKPGLNDFLLPSDFILLNKKPHSQLYFDTIKIKKKNSRENPLTNPPIGGVMSNYVLLRSRPDFENFIPFAAPSETQVSKRQIEDSLDVDDTVVINAENTHSIKMNEDAEDQRGQNEMNEGEEDEEHQPAIAQSKPAAIALAGPGGVAQASPVGTALVGPGGLAVAAPSGTAVAGPAGQGVISPSDDKAKIIHKKIKEVWN